MKLNTMSRAASIGLTLVCVFAISLKADMVDNGDFETVSSSGPSTMHNTPGTGGKGESAAEDWFIWHNFEGSTETNWMTYEDAGLPTIFGWQDGLTDHVLRVEASHAGNGLVQVLNSQAANALGSVYVWVNNNGQSVGAGIGNGGSTTFGATTSSHHTWELLTFNEANSPVNEFIIYANSSGAEFFVDFATAQGVPEPGTGIALAGFAALGLAIRRRKR